MRKLNKRIAVAAGTAAMMVAAGVAFAYWTTTATGSGTGATTAGVTETLSFIQDPLTAMYPGDSSQPLVVAIANTDLLEKVYVTTVKAYITTNKPGCDGTDFNLKGSTTSVSPATAVALTWAAQELDALSAETDDAIGTVKFNNKATDQDACKSAVVTIHYLAS